MREFLYGHIIIWVNTMIATNIIVHGYGKVLDWYIDLNDIKRSESANICI